VLIHADRQQYNTPVLTNIIPDQDQIATDLTEWLKTTLKHTKTGRPKVVLVAMTDEREPQEYPLLPGLAHRSIRNQRKAFILKALENFHPIQVEVPDYSFRHGLAIWQAHPDADIYISLSDQIAIAIKHLLIAKTGCADWMHRVVGFDNSQLAQQEGLVSFAQDLNYIGKLAVNRLSAFFEGIPTYMWPEPSLWPRPDETPIKVFLAHNQNSN